MRRPERIRLDAAVCCVGGDEGAVHVDQRLLLVFGEPVIGGDRRLRGHHGGIGVAVTSEKAQQLVRRHVERLREPIEDSNRWFVQTALELAQVGVGEIGELGELSLGELGQASLTPDEVAEGTDAGIVGWWCHADAGADFSATVFFAAVFLATVFLATVFLAAAFFEAAFFAAVFFTGVVLATVFLAVEVTVLVTVAAAWGTSERIISAMRWFQSRLIATACSTKSR